MLIISHLFKISRLFHKLSETGQKIIKNYPINERDYTKLLVYYYDFLSKLILYSEILFYNCYEVKYGK